MGDIPERPPEPPDRVAPLRKSDGTYSAAYLQFLNALEQGYSISRALKFAGLKKATAYENRDKDEQFHKDWLAAWDTGSDMLMDEGTRRAISGIDKPQIYKGKLIYSTDENNNIIRDAQGKPIPLTVKEYSDHIWIKLMEARLPHMFRNRVEHTGKDGGAIPIRIEDLTTAQLEVLLKRIEAGENKAKGQGS